MQPLDNALAVKVVGTGKSWALKPRSHAQVSIEEGGVRRHYTRSMGSKKRSPSRVLLQDECIGENSEGYRGV